MIQCNYVIGIVRRRGGDLAREAATLADLLLPSCVVKVGCESVSDVRTCTRKL